MYGLQRLSSSRVPLLLTLNFFHSLKHNWGPRIIQAECISYGLQGTSEHRHKPTAKYFIQRQNSNKNMPRADEESRNLDFEQLVEFRNKENNILIDVREQQEVDETGTLPGAFHIPLGEIEKALATPEDVFKKVYKFNKPTLEDHVIFSCRSGKRSYAALEKALASGFVNAKHYTGGWLDWEKHTSGSS